MTDTQADISFFEEPVTIQQPSVPETYDEQVKLASFLKGVASTTNFASSEPEWTPEADKEAHDHEQPDFGYVAPDSNAESMFKSLTTALRRGLKPGMSVMKGADGKRYMLIVTSNSYQDRDGETLTTDALKTWVDTCWKAVEDEFATDNPLVYWHDMRVKMGDIVWSDMRGPFLVELAVESEGVLAQKMFDYVESHPDEKWGASHKFAYFKAHKDADGIYHNIMKKETTVLPRSAAANALTFSGVIPMVDKRSAFLNKMLGLDNAAELLDKGIDVLVSELNKQGIDHKSADKPDAQEVAKSFGGLVSALIDSQADMDERIEANTSEVATLKEAKEVAEKSAKETADSQAAKITALEAQVSALKAQLDTRPRQGSQSTETQINPATLPDAIKQNLAQKDAFWNTEVMP